MKQVTTKKTNVMKNLNLEIFFPNPYEMRIFDASSSDLVPLAVERLAVEIKGTHLPFVGYFDALGYRREDDELLKVYSEDFGIPNEVGFNAGIYTFNYIFNNSNKEIKILYYAPILKEIERVLSKLNTKVEIRELSVNYIPDVQDKLNYDNLENVRLIMALLSQLEFEARKLRFKVPVDEAQVNDILIKLKRLLNIVENGTNKSKT